MYTASRAKRGFTLIELLVVIAIIGILSSVVLASLNTARQKARDTRRIADLKQIQLALQLFFDSCSVYPSSISAAYNSCSGGLAPQYIAVVPADPLTTNGAYKYAAGGTSACGVNQATSYHLGAIMEDSTNIALTGDADAAVMTNVCSGSPASAPDFRGDSSDCSTTQGTDKCYDVKP